MSNSSMSRWSEDVLPLRPLGASEEEEDQEKEEEEEEEENGQSTVELPVATAADVPTFGQSVA